MLTRRWGAANRFRRINNVFIFSIFLIFLLSICIALPVRAGSKTQPKPTPSLKQDESCLACHGQAGMTSPSGKSISIDPSKHAASVHGALACQDCHATIKDSPHPVKVAKIQCATCHADESAHVPGSIHSALVCLLPRGSACRHNGGGTDAGKMRNLPCRRSKAVSPEHSRAGRGKRRPRRS